MSISPVNGTPWPLEPASVHPESATPGTQDAIQGEIRAPQDPAGQADHLSASPSSRATEQDVLWLEVWSTSPRTFGLEPSTLGVRQDMPSSSELDQIAANIVSYLT